MVERQKIVIPLAYTRSKENESGLGLKKDKGRALTSKEAVDYDVER